MFWEDLSYVIKVKSTVEISQNLVAFSEYMNFTTYDFRIFDMFCGGCCYPDTKEEINENPKSRPDKNTIEYQENKTISPHFKTITYGRNRFGTYELSSSDESLMDILIHGRNDSDFSGSCVNTPGDFCKINIKN